MSFGSWCCVYCTCSVRNHSKFQPAFSFALVKKEQKAQLDSLRKEDPNAKTLEWQEFGKDQERYFTNKEKIDDIIKYMKNDLKMSDEEINK